MEARDVQRLTRVLLYGSDESRARLARELADTEPDVLPVLASTVKSDESLLLRARCLEALGHAAAVADPVIAEQVLHELFPPEET